ncbi:MAG: sodium/proline symporter PutP [Pseudohongiellaceae bacterium]
MNSNLPVLLSFVLYLALILVIGLKAYGRTHDIGDYILGGRKLGSMVTALSAGASDMSGWLLLGLPGAIYLAGISEIWIGIGLVIGAYLNWLFVARPLRISSQRLSDSLTLPDYFENRFGDRNRWLRVLSALVILLFFTFYTASGLVGGAILFETTFDLNYFLALGAGSLIIVVYTFVGGFLAVSWTDALQALLMLAALIVAPLAVIAGAGGAGQVWEAMRAANPQSTVLFTGAGAMSLISLLAWGLGYMGQPHILARFMAIEHPDRVPVARRIAMSWMVLVLAGSVLTGLAGIAYFSEQPLANPETVFIALSQALFNPWVAGLITAAILSAIMSTIDSQLLVSSSVISEDFYRVFIRPRASRKELLLVSRLAVVVIAAFAVVIAADPDSRVLDLVSYAWAGFGAAFGPAILLSLYWPRMTSWGAFGGIITGAATVVVWANLSGGWFDLYEIIPGFILSGTAIYFITVGSSQREDETRVGSLT